MDDMAMGGMAMGGMLPLMDYPQMYWAVVGSIIGLATLANLYNYILCWQRIGASRRGDIAPAKPKSIVTRSIATIYAMTRESANVAIEVPLRDRTLRLPTLGRTSLVAANMTVLVVLCFYGFDMSDRWSREDIGYRTGFVTIGQIPLLFLLAGRNNVIGYLTGVSHERLNWLHRWSARCLLLTATIHMGYFFADWAPYNYIGTEMTTNSLAWKGVAAWAVLLWIVFSSMSPIRGLCYEFFVIQHLISFAVFLGLVYVHTPTECHSYIWAPVAIFVFDRTIRIVRLLYANMSLFHPKQRRIGQKSSFWACRAEFTPLAHNTTRVTIKDPPISWRPGQHVFLSFNSLIPFQSHPFTIASLVQDERMEFLIKSKNGGTKQIFKYAERSRDLPLTSLPYTKNVAIEGPYGCLRPLRQFGSVILFAGSTGATFTFPLLRDILTGWADKAAGVGTGARMFYHDGLVTRHIRFVWVVKSRDQFDWFASTLSDACDEFQALKEQLREIKLDITTYVTCDEAFTEERKAQLSSAYRTTQSSTSLSAPLEEANTIRDGREETREPEKRDDIMQVTSRLGSSNSHGSRSKAQVHPSLSVVFGRPKSKNIIRQSLEQALGESAVVVCGPQGLVADIKQHVCALSDERAVHKGTGAQGIYLHTESFAY